MQKKTAPLSRVRSLTQPRFSKSQSHRSAPRNGVDHNNLNANDSYMMMAKHKSFF